MNVTGAVTSLSWIPSEAVVGVGRWFFDAGITHYDRPPPDVLEDLGVLRHADRFRFANRLAAWALFDEDASTTSCGYSGGGVMGRTTVRLGPARSTFQAFALEDIRHPPEIAPGRVRFVQTAGGRAGVPAPRRVAKPPFVQFHAPMVWTTLALTLHADGSVDHEVLGASPFPRHWIYDHDGQLVSKVGLMEYETWWSHAFGRHTPWGDEESPALVTAAETALERELGGLIMQGAGRHAIRSLAEGQTLTRQGEPGNDIYLVLDGVLRVEQDGRCLADIGPGALVGERAVLEGGRRTSTLRAITACRVAVSPSAQLDRAKLADLRAGHRREGGWPRT